jgi:hypothetical protein
VIHHHRPSINEKVAPLHLHPSFPRRREPILNLSFPPEYFFPIRGVLSAQAGIHQSNFRFLSRLQLGRGLSTAETCNQGGCMIPRPDASIGPRSFNRGNDCFSLVPPSTARSLQLGRGLSTAETRRRPRIHRLGLRHFNWATVFQPRKQGAWFLYIMLYIASIGPRSFNRGNSVDAHSDNLRHIASIGPRSFNRGNRLRRI